MSVLLIDNYDSFTFNLFQFLCELGAKVRVVRNDQITVENIREEKPSHIILSPGPGSPDKERDFGVCGPIIKKLAQQVPILGVCLGHQGIAHHLGGTIVRAPQIIHGKTSRIRQSGGALFRDLPEELEVMRYHSLLVERTTLPACLRETAVTCEDNLIMAIEHREWPLYGVQFHPESIGTPQGKIMLRNFLEG